MILYLLERYFFIAVIVVVIALAMMFTFAGTDYLLLKLSLNLALSGVIAAFVTNSLFQRRNLWVLYHNLRFSKHLLLVLCLLLFQLGSLLFIGLLLWASV